MSDLRPLQNYEAVCAEQNRLRNILERLIYTYQLYDQVIANSGYDPGFNEYNNLASLLDDAEEELNNV